MKKSNEIINDILEFYEKKEDINNFLVEYIDSINGKKVMHVSYYRDQHSRPINKLEITIIWSENDGNYVELGENCIAKRNRLNQFEMFDNNELRFFDCFGMNICEEASNKTGQTIDDWFHKKD